MEFEPVIGLEIHVEMDTKSKVFCGCPTGYDAEPNTQTCPICLGMPGVLPVLNQEVLDRALRACLALNCEINRRTIFERKNYYYPDLPKNYQISQKALTLGRDGWFDVPLNGYTRRVGIWDVHIEEDAGKLIHPEYDPTGSLVDLNRAGVPLLEIVCAPDLRSVEELQKFMEMMRELLIYVGVSPCQMQWGQMRFEAGISVRPQGSTELGKRIAEIKNLNSFRAVVQGVAYEIQRQAQALREGQTLESETRLWDETRGVTEAMRSKEEAQDYRYFPEPDLVPILLDEEYLERIRATLPELPEARRKRMMEQYGIPAYDVGVLTTTKEMADYYEEAVRLGGDPKKVSNWVMGDLLRLLNARQVEMGDCPIRPQHLVDLIQAIDRGEITGKVGKDVLTTMFETGRSPQDIIQAEGLAIVSDASALDPIVDRVLAENPDAVANYRKGKTNAIRFLIGQVMKATRGQAKPEEVNRLLEEKLAE